MREISRESAIALLRAKLVELTKGEGSTCAFATKNKIFCQGFARFSTRDLFRKFDWLAKTFRIRSRRQLEEYADVWMRTLQEVWHLDCACDAVKKELDLCQFCPGWDGSTDQQLADFVRELCDENIHVGNSEPRSGETRFHRAPVTQCEGKDY